MSGSRYLTLDADEIVATIERLHARIGERFPESGLQRACGEFLAVARGAKRRAALARKIWQKIMIIDTIDLRSRASAS